MSRKYLFLLLVILIIILACIAIVIYIEKSAEALNVESMALFNLEEGWGPCQEGQSCQSSTTLYYSGKLVITGYGALEKQLGPGKVQEIIDKIKLSGIMDKDCTAGPVMDYQGTYTFTIGSKTKVIDFPGCENQISEIVKLIVP